MKKVLAFAVLAWALGAQATVIVYNQKYTENQTGNGGLSKTALSGYFLLDDAGGIIQIDVNAKAHTFTEYDYSSYTWQANYLSTPLAQHLAISIQFDHIGGMFLEGANTVLATGTGTFNAPKTMKLTGNQINSTESDPTALFFTWSGTVVFNSSATAAGNIAGRDVYSEYDALRTSLLAAGYIEQ